MTLGTRTLPLVVWLWASGCHSANWSPPEPQQAPDPAPSPIAIPAPTASAGPEPPASVAPAPPAPTAPAPPASASSEPAAAPSSTAPPGPEAPTTPTSAPPAASDAKPKPVAKGSSKAPESTAVADAYAGPDPCQAKAFHYSVIGGACKKAGRKPVKDIMRGVVKKAKAAGQDVQCTSCHIDTATYLLKPNAVSDIKQWL
jgi:hypothetical protein